MSNTVNFFDNLDWGSWLYGLFYGMIGGGASAVVSGVTVALSDPKDYAIGSGKFLGLVTTVFIANAVLSMFLYLKQTPLPAAKVVTAVQTVEQPGKPTKTITTVEETKLVKEIPTQEPPK